MATSWIAALQSHDGAGVLYINTLGIKMDPIAGAGLNATDLAGECNTWFGAEYRACLGTGLTFDSITVRKTPAGSGVEGAHAIGLAGTVAENNAAPRELCIVVSWKTDVAGRSSRGHIALPAPPTNAITSASATWDLTTTYFTTTLKAFLDKLDAGHDWTDGGSTAGHLSQIVYSRKLDAYYDVKTRLVRSQKRWLERRQTAP